MFNKHIKSLFLASLTILISFALNAIYNIYGIFGINTHNAFAATASLSTTGSVSIDVSASGNSANIGTDTLTVNTTCSTGYTVTISSSINDTTLYKDGDSTSNSRISPSLGTASNPLPIIGDDGNGNSYLGTWGYSMMTGSTVNGTFIGLNSTPTIIKQSNIASGDGTGDPTTGIDTIPVYYGVSVTPSLEAGNYTMAKDNGNNPATIIYQLTMPVACQTYTIKYDGNNNDAGTTMSVVNDNLNLNDETTLMPSNYKRQGYGFAGWNTKADGTGTDFGPMETVVLSSSDTKGVSLINAADPTTKEITLYAKWIQAEQNVTMQTWSGCNSMTAGQVTALTDTRDNNTYAIAKLADGQCWMIENLRLDNTANLDSTNTNNPAPGFTQLSVSSDNWCTDANATCIDQSMLNTSNLSNADMANPDDPAYLYGNYYNWYSATAGWGTYSQATNNHSVDGSICPAGWRLPSGGNDNNATNSDYYKLTVAIIGSQPNIQTSSSYYQGETYLKAVLSYPNNIVFSGQYFNTSMSNQTSYGFYRTNTSFNNELAYRFYIATINNNIVIPGTGTLSATKYAGYSVRCVADTTFNSITTMQEMTNSVCSAANVGDRKILRDTRDNKTYAVRKMEDGKCWMTQNLALGSTVQDITITPQDSDVLANFTIPAADVQTTDGVDWDTSVDAVHVYNTGDTTWVKPTSVSAAATVNTTGVPDTQSRYTGNLYNFYTATAGTGTSAMTSGDASSSICPKGWKLPAGGANSDSANLIDVLVGIKTNTANVPNQVFSLMNAPFYLSMAGTYGLYDGSFVNSNIGKSIALTTSTIQSATHRYVPTFVFDDSSNVGSSNMVYPLNSSLKRRGFSVRCIVE